MAERRVTLRYVAVTRDQFAHAVLPVDFERARTVCGAKVLGALDDEPRPADRCPECWSDWRVRGDEVRYRPTRR